MGLNPITPGLRRIDYDARSAAKVQLTIQPGDTLAVSDDVAEQLLRESPQFKDADATQGQGAPAPDDDQDAEPAAVATDVDAGEAADPPKRRSSRKG